MTTRLNKAGQAEARRLAEGAMCRAPDLQSAKDESYRHGMYVLNNSRDRRAWRIADEMDAIIRTEGPAYFARRAEETK